MNKLTRFIPILSFLLIPNFCRAQVSEARVVATRGIANVVVYPDSLIYQEYYLADGENEKELHETIKGYRSDIKKALFEEDLKTVKLSFSAVDQGGSQATNTNNLPGFFVPNHIRKQNAAEFQSRQLVTVVIDGVNKENFKKNCELMRKVYLKIRESEVPFGNPNQNRNNIAVFQGMIQDNQFRSKVNLFNGWKNLSKKAFLDAKEKAKGLAEISGGRLGKVLSVSVSSGGNNSRQGYYPSPYNSTFRVSSYPTGTAVMLSDIQLTPTNVHSNGLSTQKFGAVLDVKFELIDN